MIPPWLIARLTTWLQPALLVALVAVSAWCWWTHWQLGAERRAHARTVAQYQVELIERQRAAIEAAEAFRQQEQDWQRQKAAAEVEHARALAARDRVIADLRRTADELRDAATRYAVGRPAADDSLDSCRARAATLAELFAEADAAAGELAAAADAHAGEVRLLRDAWPR